MSKIDLKSIDLNLLHVFVILWDTRSVSRASEALSITQPAVSHALKRLRERLGDPLFISGRTGLVPTSRASFLIQPVRDALGMIRDAIEESSTFVPGSAQREFRIGMLDLVEYWMLPALVETMKLEAPGVLVHGMPLPNPQEAAAMLESGDLDVILTDKEPAEKSVRAELVYEEHLTSLVWKQECLQAETFPMSLFVERPHIVFQGRDLSIDRALALHGHRRTIGAVAHNFLTMPVVAARTGYICSLPSRIAATFADRFGLSEHLPPIQTDAWPLFAAWHTRKHADPALQWLISKVRAVAQSR
jgi:DNA-binding transcriptional LysR family regulator